QLVLATDVALRLVGGDLRGVEPRLRRRDLLGPCAGDRLLQRRLRAQRTRLRRLDLLGPRAGLELVERRLRLRERGLGLRELRGPVGGLEHDERLAGLDLIAFLDRELLDAAARAAAERDRARLDGTAPLERLVRELVAVVRVPARAGDGQRERNEARGR